MILFWGFSVRLFAHLIGYRPLVVVGDEIIFLTGCKN